MASIVVDTHTVVWYLLKSSRLSKNGYEALDNVGELENIVVPSVSLVEIIYLVEKTRIDERAYDLLLEVLKDSKTGWILYPLDLGVAEAVSSVSRERVPDMPDRIIAATAVHLGLPLVTRDSRLKDSGVQIIW